MDTISWILNNIVSIILAGVAVIISLGTFYVSRQRATTHQNQLNDARDKLYGEYLRNAMSDLYDVYKTEDLIKSKNQCELFATRILDILSILTHLSNENKKIEKNVLIFIQFDLDIAKSIVRWFDEKKLYEKYNVNNSEKMWTNLSEYFSDKKDTEDYDYLKLLPQKLKIYDTLPDYG
jgi:hypothetical protein